MFAPIFDTLESNAAAVAALGSPLRAFSFGEVVGQPTATPYLVWQNLSGVPYNYLGQLPDKDDVSLQVDVYDATAAGARQTARVARDALEGVCYMVSGPREIKDTDTKLFRVSMDFDWIIDHNEV